MKLKNLLSITLSTLMLLAALTLSQQEASARDHILQSANGQENLLGYWKFDEASGTTASDSSGNNNDGTVYGATWTSGQFGSALDFDGEDDYVAIPDLFSSSPSNLTVSAWINSPLDNSSDWTRKREIVHHFRNGEFELSAYDEKVEFLVKLSNGGVHGIKVPTAPNVWHNITGVWAKGSYVKLYVDEVLEGEKTVPDLYLWHWDLPASIGSYGQYVRFFNGTIDEVKIYASRWATACEYEHGSWCDEQWFHIAYGANNQMEQLLNHQVDAMGEPSPTEAITLKIADEGIPGPDKIEVLEDAGYSLSSTGAFDMAFYAINCREGEGKEPLDDPEFRKALAYCMDKDTIYPTIYGPLVTPIYNWAPPAQAFWCNPDVEDAFPRFNLQTAIDILVAGGYTPVDAGNNPVANPQPGNIDHWHMPGGTTDMRSMSQGVPVTSMLGMQVSQWIESDLHSIGLPIYHTPLPFDYIVYQQWLAPPFLNWDTTIGIGLTFGLDPVFDKMYHSDAIPFANIWGLEDTEVDDYINTAMSTLDWDEARANLYTCGELLSEIMPSIPMIMSMKYSAVTTDYNEEPGVLNWVNMIGFGGYNLWSALVSHREYSNGSLFPINNWLMGGDADILNPLTSDTAYEWQLLSLVYSTLLHRNPYTFEIMPWCVTDFPVIELWNGTHTAAADDPDFTDPTYDPSPVGSTGFVIGEKMTWTLRDDMTWHDGMPVTPEDVEFCLDLMVNQNNERYDSIHKWIHDVNVVGTYVFEVYYNARYLWAHSDISDIALLAPKHIWEPYISGEDQILWTADDRDHRLWLGHEWTNAHGYTAPIISTASGPSQLTHLIGNGPFIYPYGGWTPGTSMQLISRARTGSNRWHLNRTLIGDIDCSGYVEVPDLWYALIALGTTPGMPGWLPQADIAPPSGLIDGRDIEALYENFGSYWYGEPP